MEHGILASPFSYVKPFEFTGLNLEEKTNGMTVIYVFSNEVLVGWFSLSDTCRTGAVEAIKDLKKLGNKVVMLTGDSWGSASTVQRQVGVQIDTTDTHS